MKTFIQRIKQFLSRDVWLLKLDEMPKRKSFFIRQLRIILVAVKGFNEDKGQQQASALTYYSLLSIVPVLALGFAIAKGFGLEKKLETEILKGAEGHEEILHWTFDFANSMLENTKGGVLAGIGVVVLLWSVLKVLGNIEQSFNDIWQVKKGRSWPRKLTEYTSIMLFAPILMIMASSVTVVIATHTENLVAGAPAGEVIGPFVLFLIELIPYGLIWLLFTFLYMVMPNTKVNLKSALIAGFVAGVAFQVSEWAYIKFQVGASSYGAIYGSFAALPLFLIWVRIAWLITLFGGEISFANQNLERYEFELDKREMSFSFKRLVTLLVAHYLVRNFEDGKPAVTESEIADHLKMPVRLVRLVLDDLTECGIIAIIQTDSLRDSAYQPAKGTDHITVRSIIEAIEDLGVNDIPLGASKEYKVFKETLEKFAESLQKAPENVALKTI